MTDLPGQGPEMSQSQDRLTPSDKARLAVDSLFLRMPEQVRGEFLYMISPDRAIELEVIGSVQKQTGRDFLREAIADLRTGIKNKFQPNAK